MPLPRLFTLDEIAERLNVSKTTIYRLVERRQLPFYKVGRSLRFAEEDMIAYLAAHRTDTMTETLRRTMR